MLTVFANSVADLVPRTLQWLRPIAPAFRPRLRSASRDQARRNIAEHYDLSNDLFAEFLDETMTYSCALFSRAAGPASQSSDLAEAQRRKIDRLLDMAGVGPGSRVLEIGTGWGELCIRAAARGAHVRSVTLSVEQQRLARLRVAAAGLSDLVRIDLCDYRDVEGCYDAVVSVEMIEAVGYRSWPGYFATLERLVRPGGRVVDPGDHHAARPDAGQSQHAYLDPEVHLPRRTAALYPCDRGHHRATHWSTHGRHDLTASALCRDLAAVAQSV